MTDEERREYALDQATRAHSYESTDAEIVATAQAFEAFLRGEQVS